MSANHIGYHGSLPDYVVEGSATESPPYEGGSQGGNLDRFSTNSTRDGEVMSTTNSNMIALQETLRAAEEQVALVREEIDRGLSAEQDVRNYLIKCQEAHLVAQGKSEEAHREFMTAKAELDGSRKRLAEWQKEYIDSGKQGDDLVGKQLQEDVSIKLRLVEMVFKISEKEEEKLRNEYERLREAERRKSMDLERQTSFDNTFHHHQHEADAHHQDGKYHQDGGHQNVSGAPATAPQKIRRRRLKPGQTPIQRRRLTCYVPFHQFRLADLAASHSPLRGGFDIDKLNSIGAARPSLHWLATSPLMQGQRRGGWSLPGVSSQLSVNPMYGNEFAYQSLYPSADSSALWALPNTIHDPSWVWNFDDENVVHAHREIQPYMGVEVNEEMSSIERTQHIFVFEFGCVVLWNLPESQELSLLNSLKVFGTEESQTESAEYASESIVFEAGPKSSIQMDVVTVQTGLYGEISAYSFALAQSSLMRLFEWRTQQVIDRNGHIPLGLIRDGKIHMTQQEIAHEIGWVFFERAKIGLSDSTDPAQYFWEHTEFESVYNKALEYFDIEGRKTRLNSKLGQLKELFDLLNSQAANMHDVHLEWIVIGLIVVEVACSLFWNIIVKDIFGLVGQH